MARSAEWEKELIEADWEDTMDKLREANKEVGRLTSEIRDTFALVKKMRAKKSLSRKKRRFLLSKLSKTISRQREEIRHHIQVRMMVVTKLRGDHRRFDIERPRIQRLVKTMGKQIEALKKTAKVLSIYERYLREEAKKGAA